MATTYFLFDGGHYKRGVDDERVRVPLIQPELDEVLYDPEVPSDTDNSIGTEINLAEYADILCNLAVGDKIILGLVPDATIVRGMWVLNFKCVNGFTVKFDLVKGADIIADIKAGGDGSAAAAYTPATIPSFDFSNCLGDTPCDAVTKMRLPYMSSAYEDHRNPLAMDVVATAPTPLKLGEACYMRAEIIALGDFGNNSTAPCCDNCAEAKYPSFQLGVVYDRLCADKLRRQRYCNCGNTGLCSEGCQ